MKDSLIACGPVIPDSTRGSENLLCMASNMRSESRLSRSRYDGGGAVFTIEEEALELERAEIRRIARRRARRAQGA